MTNEQVIRRNLTAIQERIEAAATAAGRQASEITLVAVTKSVGVDEIRVLRDLGIRHFGENRVDVAREKVAALADDALVWHMVGNVQRRKAKEVLRVFDTIDALDRVALADALQQRCEAEGVTCRTLLEVNVSGEAQKHGVPPDSVEEVLAHVETLSRVQVDGLLTMAPYEATDDVLRSVFRTLRDLANRAGLGVVSMGMSNDFESAIAEGATQVRIGRALFKP